MTENYRPGDYGAADVFPGPQYLEDPTSENPLTPEEKRSLCALVEICSQSDTTARRFQVEKVWQARLFKNGIQHLIPNQKGGWLTPGANTPWGVNGTMHRQRMLNTNMYGAVHDIITSALASDVPKVEFFPVDPDQGPDQTAAESADKYALCWARSNDLRTRCNEAASRFFTDGVAIVFTRSVANAQEFGRVSKEVDIDPFVPEDGPSEDAKDIEQPDVTEQPDLDVVEDQDSGQVTDSDVPKLGAPRIRSETSIFGALEAKCPMTVDRQKDMSYVQIFQEVDLSTAKSRYPYISDKIQPGSTKATEVELDRLARMNVKLALPGSFVTGDSLIRDVTIQYTFLRPSVFFDDKASATRDDLLSKFPNGALVVHAGSEFACAYSISLDDYITVVHSGPGDGQNRRALGGNLIDPQKRLNRWMDLQDDLFVRTVPHRYMNDVAFNLDAIAAQRNVPGATHPFKSQPGIPVSDLIFVEPSIPAPASLSEFIQYFINTLPEVLAGATPALFGGSNGDKGPESGVALDLRRAQSLMRQSLPWAMIKHAIARAAKHAVQCAADSGNDTISDTVPGHGRISIECADLRGNVLCYPENDSDFPQSWSQRESRYVELVNGAQNNDFYKALLAVPKNAKVAKDALRMNDLEVPGADSVIKQQAEFTELLKTGPTPNPQVVELQQEIQKITQELVAFAARGQAPPVGGPETIQQLQQQISQLPPLVSTFPVADDDSENHAVEAATCFSWMNSPEGRTFANGDQLQRDGFKNIKIHRQQHMAMAQKLAPPVPPPEVKLSLSAAVDKLPPNVQTQVLEQYGVESTAQDFAQGQTHEVTQESEQPTAFGGVVKQKVAIAGKPLS